ncbi:hypothetical protein [Pseudozobellia thermophila]|uniref:Uncharacterized protein n=1 Tax=Pseudozobellia thermophila TaxID=192903 RepID=A0A1M6AMP8_9FLAO|nr:hypothetical protein [Pseudozobellia thermophila]SHI37598.1 hypothetical protein SAMN04488513_101111 [Pseudozobellia thermophila]
MRPTKNRLALVLWGVLLLGSTTVFSQGVNKKMTKMEEVMVAHDEVMDKMPKLSKLINQLQTRANASYEKEKYEKAIADLKAANKSMMDWMHAFGKRFDADEMMKGKELSEQKQKWLLEEERNVELLREEIDSGIARAEKVLGL